MNPLDRIKQLTERAENANEQCDIVQRICESAQREVAILRSQLADARQQLERDSATIAKLSADKRELVSALRKYRDEVVLCTEKVDTKTAWEIFQDSEEILSRHA